MNYAAHNKELHNSLLYIEEPVVFTKADSALLSDGRPFFIPAYTSRCDYETELLATCRLDCVRKVCLGTSARALMAALPSGNGCRSHTMAKAFRSCSSTCFATANRYRLARRQT